MRRWAAARLASCAIPVLVLVLMLAAPPMARTQSVDAAASREVDLLLVLAADVSRSVDSAKFHLQRSGYAAALADPRVLEAIGSGRERRIAVIFVEWSGATAQEIVVDWTLIAGAADARRFGDRLLEAPRAFAERTSISGAIDFSLAQLERAPFTALKRTIDISGDGTHNSGRDVRAARDEALARDVTINAIAILSERPLPWNPDHTHPPGGLAGYFRDNVIGGPGAFVLEAASFEAFGHALINKLVAEIAAAGEAPYRTTPDMQQGFARGGVTRLLR